MEPAALLEEIRFGYGPKLGAPLAPAGVDADRVLAQLTAVDPAASAWSRPSLAERYVLIAVYEAQKKTVAGVSPEIGLATKQMLLDDIASFVARPAFAGAGFVERLCNLWANRLTVSNAAGGLGRYVQSYHDEAIRPHVGGTYADLLRASLWHPGMQYYLSQANSFGPDSEAGKRRGRGLNENLAREFLELHSMRTGYTQDDVTQLALLLAGMISDQKGQRVDPRRVQPGRKVILGQTFDDSDPAAEINRLVTYVARRPETARNVAFTLARHFIADDPPADLVDALAATYQSWDGDLPAVYRVLLQHPAAHDPERRKLRSPQEFAAASLRLLGLTAPDASPIFAKLAKRIPIALAAMGQPPYRALRPDGWPEVAEDWMSPPMMAARIDWAVDLARLAGDRVDPVAMTGAALGPFASPLLLRSVSRAEQRWEGLAVLLGSPEFSRR